MGRAGLRGGADCHAGAARRLRAHSARGRINILNATQPQQPQEATPMRGTADCKRWLIWALCPRTEAAEIDRQQQSGGAARRCVDTG